MEILANGRRRIENVKEGMKKVLYLRQFLRKKIFKLTTRDI